jgi:hypothetical protein
MLAFQVDLVAIIQQTPRTELRLLEKALSRIIKLLGCGERQRYAPSKRWFHHAVTYFSQC